MNRKTNNCKYFSIIFAISKGSLIDYRDKLEMQDYMKPNKVLTFEEQLEIFSCRSERNEISLKHTGFKIIPCVSALKN